MIFSDDPHKVVEIYKDRFPTGLFNIVIGSPFPFFIEFLPAGSNKGEGLRRLCEIINQPMSKVISFGDGDNDKEFLEMSGFGIAMKNAGK